MGIVRKQKRAKQDGRRGFLSMELVLTLPFLFTVLLALFEFSFLFFARGEVCAACRAGARKATLPGVTQLEIEEEVRKVLAPRLWESLRIGVELGEQSGDVVAVVVRVDMNSAAPDLLWPIGYTLKGRDLIAQIRMIKE